MDQFKLKFLEEAADLIDDLEKILLTLEEKGISSDSIEHIFRVMHTIKGSSSMFGFDTISEFTHHLETIYDLIRTGKMQISKEILDTTLAAVDHIRQLLEDDKLSNSNVKSNHKIVGERIKSIIGTVSIEEQNDKVEIKSERNSMESTYYILFNPHKDILVKGNNPLYLLSDLKDLGECKIIWHTENIPGFVELNAQESHVYWEIILSCKENQNEIKEVFIFVLDECELSIVELAKENLFENIEFKHFVETISIEKFPENLTKLTSYINSFEEVKSIHITEEKYSPGIESEKANHSKDGNISSIRVASDKLDDLMNLVSELVTTQARLSLYSQNNIHQNELNSIAENIEKISRRLRDNTFSICLIPIENMLTRFQRLIRDLSKQLKKEVIFITEGTETEIDKTIIDNLTDPLMHIFRNCIDHGIETADERVKKGKSKKGTISLTAYYSGTNVHIEIKDDGAGINATKIKEKAISKGLISPDLHLSEKEIFDLMFLPGFSTASQVTEVSGRGVGMDVVKRQINALRGSVEIESIVDQGTTITLILPLTLSIIDGLLVQIHKTKYVIPLTVVDKCYEVKQTDIENKFDDLLELDNKLVPFFNLRKHFDYTDNTPDTLQVIVIKNNNKKIGITVDYVIGEYQAVIKPLGKMYKNADIMSGATILGDGTIALVMDTNQIIKKFAIRNTD